MVLPRVCVERNLLLRWHRHVHEKVNEWDTSATTEAIDESYHFRGIGNQIVSSFMKLRGPGSIDGKEVSFSPRVTPGDIPPLVGNDHLIPWGCSIHLYPDECRLEIPSRGIDAKLHVTSSNHILVNLADLNAWMSLIIMCGPRNEAETVKRQVPRVI